MNFSTKLLWEYEFVMTTKVVAHEIIYLLLKFQVYIMYRTLVMSDFVSLVFLDSMIEAIPITSMSF